jgi:hypothetical protein
VVFLQVWHLGANSLFNDLRRLRVKSRDENVGLASIPTIPMIRLIVSFVGDVSSVVVGSFRCIRHLINLRFPYKVAEAWEEQNIGRGSECIITRAI